MWNYLIDTENNLAISKTIKYKCGGSGNLVYNWMYDVM